MKKISIFLLVIFVSLSMLTGCKDPKKEGGNYNIIMTCVTIPPMITLLDMVDKDLTENETYAWIGRQNTIASVQNLKNTFKKLTLNESWSTASNIPNSVITEINEFVSEKWFESEETANFTVYVSDYGVLSALYILENNGIGPDHYEIHMLEDGSMAYSQFITDQAYATSEGKARLDQNIAELQDHLNKIRQDKFELPQSAFQNSNLTYAAATLPKVDYYIQFPELLVSENADITNMIKNNELKLVEKKLTALYNGLTEEKKETIRKIIIAESTLDQIKKDDKEKVLMITGTSLTGEGDILTEENVSKAGEGGNFETIVTYLVNKYPNYKIIYKGHPAWGILPEEIEGSRFIQPNRYNKVEGRTENGGSVTEAEARAFLDRRVAFLKGLNIEILPAQTPAEALIWAIGDDLVLAGYDSSLYMNAKKGSLLAFFEDGVDSLSALNQRLYGEGGVFYNPNIEYLTYENCKVTE